MTLSEGMAAAILPVENDPGQALLFKKNLRRGGITHDIVMLDNGRKAVDYLLKQGVYAGDKRPAPSFILLDLNFPVLTGNQVLQIIKNDVRIKNIPVVVLTDQQSK